MARNSRWARWFSQLAGWPRTSLGLAQRSGRRDRGAPSFRSGAIGEKTRGPQDRSKIEAGVVCVMQQLGGFRMKDLDEFGRRQTFAFREIVEGAPERAFEPKARRM